MTSKWTTDYSALTDFISKHSEIEITPELIRIPAGVKDRFYLLFDAVRTGLVHHSLEYDISETSHLIKQYKIAADKVIHDLNLTEITGEKALFRFLNDIDNWMERELFDPLFNTLKGQANLEYLENTANSIITRAIPEMYNKGYSKWIALSMINSLEVDEIYGFNLPMLSPRERTAVAPRGSYNPLRPPEKIGKIEFRYAHFELFTVPDFIIHSKKLNKYLSVRTQYENSVADAANISQQRQWYPVQAVGDLTAGMMLVYIDDELFNLALIADRGRICRPDMIIEYRTGEDWIEAEGLGIVEMHNHGLKPVGGSYVISSTRVSQAGDLQPEKDITILETVSKAADLEPLTDRIIAVCLETFNKK